MRPFKHIFLLAILQTDQLTILIIIPVYLGYQLTDAYLLPHIYLSFCCQEY